MSVQKFDICILADETGSMSGCISQVKRNIQTIVHELFQNVPNVRISLGTFEDYDFSHVWKVIDFTSDEGALIHFMNNLGSQHKVSGRDIGYTGGRGEGIQECYEYALHKVPDLNWSSDSVRSLIIVGDSFPHSPSHSYHGINWYDELQRVKNMGINIYGIHCLSWGDNQDVKNFFKTITRETNGYHLYLDQFTMIPQMMMAICFRAMGQDRLEHYENELRVSTSGVTNGMRQMFDIMLGKKTTEDIEEENRQKYSYSSSSSSSSSTSTTTTNAVAPTKTKKLKSTGLENLAEEDFEMKPCHPSRFQILDVTGGDIDIKSFAENNGLGFQKGRGFYQFTKPELIQKGKEIILQEKSSGNFYEGNKARKMLNLITYDETKRIKPTDFAEYDVFIQSTSLTRKLVDGTKFLYDTM